MSQYRPLKEHKGQAAAPAVATRDHWLTNGFPKTLLEFGISRPDESASSCEVPWVPTPGPAVTAPGRRWEIRTTHTAVRSKQSAFVGSYVDSFRASASIGWSSYAF
jgi:hypothetical protein